MEIKEISSAFKELILPELKEIKTHLAFTNKRLDDINFHMTELIYGQMRSEPNWPNK